MPEPLDLDELVEHFTLLPGELALLRNKSGATRLGFAVMLKFLPWKGRFPRGRSDLPDEVVAFVAKQVKVSAAAPSLPHRPACQRCATASGPLGSQE